MANGLLVAASLDESVKQRPGPPPHRLTAFVAYSQAADLIRMHKRRAVTVR